MTVPKDRALFLEVSRIAKENSLPYFRQNLPSENKESAWFDPVTIADRAVEEALRRFIQTTYPDDGIIGEEFPSYQETRETLWVIDPIDGTRSFIAGIPLWGTIVGISHKGHAIAGMMAQPFTGELYYSCGKGSYLYHDNGRETQLFSSDCQKLRDAVLFSTAPELFTCAEYDTFTRLAKACKFNRFGADGYAFAMLAAGFVDIVIESRIKIYDIMGLIPLIREAGGVVSQWDGRPAEEAGNIIACATPQLHEDVVQFLQKNRK